MGTITRTRERNFIKESALAHYDGMIAWAKSQRRFNEPDKHTMYYHLHECWFSEDCDYCTTYSVEDFDDGCYKCPLSKNRECCGGLWYEMNDTMFWWTWIRKAKKVKQYIADNG
ncbi:MAG: hypothetical protein GY853_01685 [PVC group bacterium]|nr:hypothetical protein [PVC group bacterium]